MSVQVHVQANWSIDQKKFCVKLKDVVNYLTEDEFESFVQNLQSPVELNGIRLTLDKPGLSQIKEYFELVLESYKDWKTKQ